MEHRSVARGNDSRDWERLHSVNGRQQSNSRRRRLYLEEVVLHRREETWARRMAVCDTSVQHGCSGAKQEWEIAIPCYERSDVCCCWCVCLSSPILLTKVIGGVEAGRQDLRAPRSLDRVLRTGEALSCGVHGWCMYTVYVL